MPNLLFSPALLTKQIAHGGQVYSGVAVTPADGTDLPCGACTALYVTTGGNVNVNLAGMPAGTNTGLLAVASGTIIDVSLTRILSTSTTATGLYALYDSGAV